MSLFTLEMLLLLSDHQQPPPPPMFGHHPTLNNWISMDISITLGIKALNKLSLNPFHVSLPLKVPQGLLNVSRVQGLDGVVSVDCIKSLASYVVCCFEHRLLSTGRPKPLELTPIFNSGEK